MSDLNNKLLKALYWGAWRIKPNLSAEEKARAFEFLMPLMVRATRAAWVYNGPIPWSASLLNEFKAVFFCCCEITPETYAELREQGHDV